MIKAVEAYQIMSKAIKDKPEIMDTADMVRRIGEKIELAASHGLQSIQYYLDEDRADFKEIIKEVRTGGYIVQKVNKSVIEVRW